MAPQWTPRMQEVCEIICRYALETGKLPTLSEVSRRIGLSIERTRQLWWHIERYERNHHLPESVHIKRRDMGYLFAVLKDIEKAARMAGRVYPWKRRWQGPPKPYKPRDNPKQRHWATFLTDEERHAKIMELAERERQRRLNHKPRFAPYIVDCSACFGTGVQDGDWCPVCKGEATVEVP